MRVHVYRNIKSKEPQLSIRCANSHLVLGHCQAVILSEAKFIVQPSGLLRTRTTKQRNVHAWVAGNIMYVDDFTPYKDRTVNYNYDLPFEPKSLLEDMAASDSGTTIHYNPYLYDTFVDDYGSPVLKSLAATILSDGTVKAEMIM